MRYLALALVATLTIALGSVRIEEDNPHWNCATMGNLTCQE